MAKIDSYDFMYKIVVVGESGVGKTNLISRFTKNQFTSDTASTIGVEFTSKIVDVDGKMIKAQLWDTAGQERYQAVATAYYRNGSGGLLVFDLAKRRTFDNLDRWYKNMQDFMPNAKVILVGNKLDLSNKREVSETEALSYANLNNMAYVETSALNSENVEQAFVQLVNEVHKSHSPYTGLIDKPRNTIGLTAANNEQKENGLKFSNCCQK